MENKGVWGGNASQGLDRVSGLAGHLSTEPARLELFGVVEGESIED